MFETLIFVAVPTLFVLVGAVAALSFARDPEEAETGTAVAAGVATAAAPALKAAEAPAELFQPRGEPAVAESAKSKDALDVEELLASLERHIRTEREAAAAYVQRMSSDAQWAN